MAFLDSQGWLQRQEEEEGRAAGDDLVMDGALAPYFEATMKIHEWDVLRCGSELIAHAVVFSCRYFEQHPTPFSHLEIVMRMGSFLPGFAKSRYVIKEEQDLVSHFLCLVRLAEDTHVERMLVVHPELANSQRCADGIDCALQSIAVSVWMMVAILIVLHCVIPAFFSLRGGCLITVVGWRKGLGQRQPVFESTFRLLLDYRADVNAVDDYGCTALWYACCTWGGTAYPDPIQRCGMCIPYQHLGQGFKSNSKVRLLLENRADVNACGCNGETPLMKAVQSVRGVEDNVRLLLEYRADVNAADKLGRTALIIAAEHTGGRSTEHVRLLLEYQADVNAADKRGLTALSVASATKDESGRFFSATQPTGETCFIGGDFTVRVLLANRADVNAANRTGHTALSAALNERKESTVRLLLEYRADVNGYYAPNALLLAIESDFDVSTVRLLLEHRADVNEREKEGGQTALMMATDWERHSIPKLLLEYRADANAMDWAGCTALNYAQNDGMSALLKSLGCSQCILGSPVCINGLVDRPRLNGCTAKIIGPFDLENRSWPVRIVNASNQGVKGVKAGVYHIPPQNIMLAQSDLEQHEFTEPAPTTGSSGGRSLGKEPKKSWALVVAARGLKQL